MSENLMEDQSNPKSPEEPKISILNTQEDNESENEAIIASEAKMIPSPSPSPLKDLDAHPLVHSRSQSRSAPPSPVASVCASPPANLKDPSAKEDFLEDNDDAASDRGDSESASDKSKSRSKSRSRSRSRSRSNEKYKPLKYKKKEKEKDPKFYLYACCKLCKKNDKSNGKTCVCVVPKSQRRVRLGKEGCRSCGCNGCTKEDKDQANKTPVRNSHRDSHESKRKRRRRSSIDSPDSESIISAEEGFNNLANSALGGYFVNHLNIYPPLLGLGVPERTSSYILGYSKSHYKKNFK